MNDNQEINDQISKCKEILKVQDSYNYLINMPMHSVSKDTVEELIQKVKELETKFEELTNTSIEQMWLNDIKDLKPQKEFQQIKIKDMLIVDKKQAGNAILLACKEYDGQDKKYIGEYRGFDLYIQFNSLNQYYNMYLKKELYYPVELGNDVYGNLTRIDNAIENIPKSLKVEKELLQNTLQQLHNAELEVEKPFEKEDELNNALKKLSKINKELDLDKKENIPDTSVPSGVTNFAFFVFNFNSEIVCP